jgi:hypothetical protein
MHKDMIAVHIVRLQDLEGLYQNLFHEGNRDVFIMSITFGKRGANISNRHVEKYQELMAEWSRDGVFAEGITMTERGVALAFISLHVKYAKHSCGSFMLNMTQTHACR